MDAVNAGPLAFEPARAPRLADTVADQIREQILSRRLDDGGRLPPLEQMASQFGVSTPTMREALRILEAEGLIEVKRGGIGGALVQRPGPRTAAYTLALVLRAEGTPKRDVGQAVELIEPLCTALCARRPDRMDEVVPELRGLAARARDLIDDDGVGFNAAMLEFHDAMVRLSGSTTLATMVRALEDILLVEVEGWVAEAAASGRYIDPSGRMPQVEAHDRIVELVADGDADAAAALMAEHISDRTSGRVFQSDQQVDPKTVR